MIVGSGVDITEVARIAALLRHPTRGPRFRTRVFRSEEIAYCESRPNAAQSYAARFAAKEATMKALGLFVPWCDVEVVRGIHGIPGLRLHGRAAQRADELGVRRWLLSLSHTADIALAWVIAEA
ncbi:MAG: holo-[acyl-carrier-protein] synthase [Candidatus Binatia bacterium]|nr:MAG: holo-[acyl-carrier-protein] synthase [Candidatus Binatia bacterium]